MRAFAILIHIFWIYTIIYIYVMLYIHNIYFHVQIVVHLHISIYFVYLFYYLLCIFGFSIYYKLFVIIFILRTSHEYQILILFLLFTYVFFWCMHIYEYMSYLCNWEYLDFYFNIIYINVDNFFFLIHFITFSKMNTILCFLIYSLTGFIYIFIYLIYLKKFNFYFYINLINSNKVPSRFSTLHFLIW